MHVNCKCVDVATVGQWPKAQDETEGTAALSRGTTVPRGPNVPAGARRPTASFVKCFIRNIKTCGPQNLIIFSGGPKVMKFHVMLGKSMRVIFPF